MSTHPEAPPNAAWIDLGRTSFERTWALQRAVVRARATGSLTADVVLATEHDPVLTLGRGTDEANVLSADLPVFAIERGGDVTYHGPGQLVLYPCFRLEGPRRDLHAWLRDLEEVVIVALRGFDLAGRREPGSTGVWVGPHKVASIGVAVSRWVTYHGIGLNVSTDREAFRRIRPCGLEADVMRSLRDLLGATVGLDRVGEACRAAFEEVLGIRLAAHPVEWLDGALTP